MTQYVTFGIDRDMFAIPVTQVQEILELRPISRLPHAPPDIAGLIDVRGRSVAVVDFRVKLRLPPAEPTHATRIIILDLASTTSSAFGLIADRVFEVSDFEPADLESAPELGERWNSDFIAGIARWREGFVIVLHLDRFLKGEFRSMIGVGDGSIAA